MAKTLEELVKATVLDEPIDEIEIDGETYPIGNPSIGTLMEVSALISKCPSIDAEAIKNDQSQAVYQVLHHAKDFRLLGEIAATLILGVKNIKQTATIERKASSFFGLFNRRIKEQVVVDKRAELAEKICQNVSSTQFWELLMNRLKMQDVTSFFLTITTLAEANVLKATKTN